MKREILFRGKLEYNGKWIYGDLLQYENGDVAIFGEKLSSFGYECTEMSKRDRVIPAVSNASLNPTLATFQLSPLYVAEMMGYPLEWLTLPFLSQSGEVKALKR